MITYRKLISLFTFIFIIKIIASCFFPVVADEAYYYVWSNHLQLSYFDHPPMVAWLIHLFKLTVSYNNPIILRLPFVILSTSTLGLWLYLAKDQGLSKENQFLFLTLSALNPLTGLGSIMATPDVPLVFFWSLSFLCFIKIFQITSKKLFWYSLLGVALGLGFCSKYHIVLFLFSGVCSIFIAKKWKKLNAFGVVLTLVFGLLFSLPVIIWNFQNDWASFLFQLKHGFGKNYYSWTWTANYFLGQILLISPIVFISLFKKKPTNPNHIFSISHLAFFITSSFKAIVEANWPISAHNHVNFYAASELTKKQKSFTILYWFFLYLVLIGLFLSGKLEKPLQNQYRVTQLDSIVEITKDKRPLFGSSYQISSLLSWRLNEEIPKLKGLARFDFFESLEVSTPKSKEFYVLKHADSIWPVTYQYYKKVLIHDFSELKIELYKFNYE